MVKILLNKNKAQVLLFIAFIINLLQWIFILTVAYGVFALKKGIFSAIIFDAPELSSWSDKTLTTINIASSILYFGGISLGLIIPLLYKISLFKRNLFTWIATAIPIILIVTKLLLFPSPYSFLQNSSDGYIYREYVWKRQSGFYIKSWRSEKCDTCYQPHERIKWILIKKGYENKK